MCLPGCNGFPTVSVTFFPSPPNNRMRTMDIDALYDTFTNPKVVTSMLLLGIGLGILLSALVRYWADRWYMPAVFVAICTVTAVLYVYWLDRQDWRED